MNPPYPVSDGKILKTKIGCVRGKGKPRREIAQVAQEMAFLLISDYSKLVTELVGVLDHVQKNSFVKSKKNQCEV